MAVDMFLKLDGIDGESQDDKHPKEIDVLAWSWGAAQSGTGHVGGGSGGGKVSVQDLSITKYIDASSHLLLLRCCDLKPIPKGTLVVRKSGGAKIEYIKLSLENVVITHVSTGGSGGEDRLTENVTLNFAEVKFEYFLQTDKGATASGGIFNWDIAGNVAK